MPDHRRLLVAVPLLVFGLLGVVVGGGAYLAAWHTSWAYSQSGEAERDARLAQQFQTPTWLDDEAAEGPALASRPPLPLPVDAQGESNGRPGSLSPSPAADLASGPSQPADDASQETTGPRASASEIELAGADFRFLDPPEPGAHARLAVDLRNRSDAPSGPIDLAIASSWFQGYQVIGTIPAVLDDQVTPDSVRHLDFPGLDPGGSVTLELHVTAAEEEVSSPDLRLTLGDDEIGQAHPRTVAPRPRPGPAAALSIPRLALQARVVQTAWEPPSFVIGQIRGTANLSEGNTVLIGHLRGLAGNVFAQLDGLRPGDEVVAVSRGLEYRFVVSQTSVLPNTDNSPTLGTETPRLTLMTCTGTWNPITQDYSHRLWVVAEPPDLAQQTIAANQERAAQVAAQATATAQAVAAAPPVSALAVEPSPEPAPVAPLSPPALSQPAPALIAPPAVSAPPPSAGLMIQTPTAEARVPRRFQVKGSRSTPIDLSLHAWLFVRAEVEGSRWYAYPKEIVPRPDGTWEAELDLAGPANLRHELRLGILDARTQDVLLRRLAEHPNEPLDDLPPTFFQEVSVFIVRG